MSRYKNICCVGILLSGLLFFSFFTFTSSVGTRSFPYQQAGLTEHQAAAHLISRFTYGATPGQIDQVIDHGLEKWFTEQLNAKINEDTLGQLLKDNDAAHLTNTEIVDKYVKGGQLLRRAIKEGVIDKDAVNKTDKKAYRQQLEAYMKEKGLRPEKELIQQFINQKILRSVYAKNQLQEVLTEFWFNHFNVSFTKNDCSLFIPVYERETIRPHVLGSFENLLLATAQSPAMLMYLDNFSSTGVNADQVMQAERKAMKQENPNKKDTHVKKVKGLNENYAREVMELHTLGVDGGYTQKDVTEAARVLTGWTVYPMGKEGYGSGVKKMLDKIGEDKMKARGFVHEGDFLFTPNRHDDGEKMVLGKRFDVGSGYEEGEKLLTMLAHHPATAKFISRKIAIRFVNDDPPQSLIDKLVNTFTKKNGDIKEMMITLVSSPEFWSSSSVREKTKSPFELAIGTVRSLHADVRDPKPLNDWITRMGQKMYYYQAPTGFPDKGQYWINTGSLLNRMNFGLAIAAGKVKGISFDLLALNKNHEPESANAALLTYTKLMMPERDIKETIERLTPLLNDPELQKKVNEAAANTNVPLVNTKEDKEVMDENRLLGDSVQASHKKSKPADDKSKYRLSQVIGIIIGSPEFQRR